jgi:predicted NACHT family NTPase
MDENKFKPPVNNKNFIEKYIERESPSLLLYFIAGCIALFFLLMAFLWTDDIWQNLFLNLSTDLMVAILILAFVEQKIRRSDIDIFQNFLSKIQIGISFFSTKYFQFSLYTKTASNKFDKSILNSIIINRPIDDIVLKTSNNLIVCGNPGTGKTILLIRFFITKLENARKEPREKLPVFIRLNSFNPREKLLEIFLKEMRNYSWISKKNFIKHLKDGKFVFVLDGLDENIDAITVAYNILEIISSYPRCQIVISSRPINFPESLLDKFELIQIPPFTQKEINELQYNIFNVFPGIFPP